MKNYLLTSYRPYYHPNGWTLIEVMVALALMAILSTLGYKGVSILLTTESSLREESERLLELDAAFSQVNIDWNAQFARLPSVESKSSQASDSANTPSMPENFNPAEWELTPIPGWIPAPGILPRIPPPLEPYLTQRYTIRYLAHPKGGVDRFLGCSKPAGTTTTTVPVCQQWHLLHQLPITIEGSGDKTLIHEPHSMRWTLQTPQGTINRLWGFPAVTNGR